MYKLAYSALLPGRFILFVYVELVTSMLSFIWVELVIHFCPASSENAFLSETEYIAIGLYPHHFDGNHNQPVDENSRQ